MQSKFKKTSSQFLIFIAATLAFQVSHAAAAAATIVTTPKIAAAKSTVRQSAPTDLLKAGPSVEGISEFNLPNGLKVLMVPDASKPTVTVNLTYMVGSRHESYGETGMAHLLEHLIFKGSPKFPLVWGEFTKRGLRANGSTWTDRTNYFASFAYNAENLDWYLSWLADSMINSYIARKDLDTEMTVVRNEMEQGENDPTGILIERVTSAAYQWHNYGKSTIGAREDVEKVDISRLQAFYRLHYQPDNAVLIVSGQFEQAKVQALIANTFGKIAKPKRILPNLYTLDPAQDGERSVTVRRPGGAPVAVAGYHMPAAGQPDSVATALLSIVMGDTPSGRLYKALIETKLAAEIFSFDFAFHDPTLGFHGVQLTPDGDTEKVRSVLLSTIESVAKNPITAAELERAKIKWLKAWDLSFTNPERIGVDLSEAVALGDWRYYFLRRDWVKAAKLEDVQRVAQTRFIEANRTFGLFLPTDKPLRAPTPMFADTQAAMKEFKPAAAMAAGETFVASPENIDKRTDVSTLANGMKLALLPKLTRGNIVTAQLRLDSGSLDALVGKSSVASAASTLLDRGTWDGKTPLLNQQQIQDAFDKLKAVVSFGGGPGATIVSITTTRENLEPTLRLVADILRNASYPDALVDEYRTQSITAIRNQEKEPDAIASNALARADNPYPPTDVRYAKTFAEMIIELQGLNALQLRDYRAQFLGAQNAYLSVVGDFDAAKIKAVAQNAFADWKAPQPYQRIVSPFLATKAATLTALTPDKQNATLLMKTNFQMKEFDADHAAMIVGDQIFGGGQDSRLWVRIREKDGLSYGVYSGLDISVWESSATFSVQAIFAPQNLNKVKTAFTEELDKILKSGITELELKNAKAAIIKARQLNRSQDRIVMAGWVNNLRLNRRFTVSAELDKRIEAVTVDQVNAVLRKVLRPETMVFSVAGDFNKK